MSLTTRDFFCFPSCFGVRYPLSLRGEVLEKPGFYKRWPSQERFGGLAKLRKFKEYTPRNIIRGPSSKVKDRLPITLKGQKPINLWRNATF